MPLVYYKGYKAYIIDAEGKKIDLNVEKNIVNAHVLVTNSEKLTGVITVEYKLTTIQKICYITSTCSFIIFIAYIVYYELIRKNILNKKRKI